MRQTEMDLMLAQGEYEVRSYFLCGESARQNNIDGTTMLVTNKRMVLEFMNNNELSRREIPIDKIEFVKSHYYEEQEDSSYADKFKKTSIICFVAATLLIIVGGLGISNVFNIFALLGLSQFWIPIIPIVLGFLGIGLGFIFNSKFKKFKPRTGKKLELLIGTTLDFDSGINFSTDTTKSLRDNLRTYSGTRSNSLIGKVQLNPTKEAKRMINEIGALLIDIKAGLYNEDPEVKKKREKDEQAKKEEKALIERVEKKRKEKEIELEDYEEIIEEPDYKKNKQKTKEEKMLKYGAPLEFDDEEKSIPRAMVMQFEKSKIKLPSKKKNKEKSDDIELEEEYQAVLKSLNMN